MFILVAHILDEFHPGGYSSFHRGDNEGTNSLFDVDMMLIFRSLLYNREYRIKKNNYKFCTFQSL